MRHWPALALALLATTPALLAAAPAAAVVPGAAPGGPEPCDHAASPAELADPSAELRALLAAGWRVEPLLQPLLPGEPAEPAADIHGCSGIRPGARLVINGGWQCTANWIYQDEVGALYMGTAGHCAVRGDSVVAPGVGRVGDVVYSTGNGGVGFDFALVKVYPHNHGAVRASMCHWGGPVAVAEDEHYGLAPVPLIHYGHGNLWGDTAATRQRAGVIHGLFVGGTAFEFGGTIAPGDSGSAIQFSTGHAVGVITHGLIAPGVGVGVVLGLGTRVQYGLWLAERATGHQFEVAHGLPVDLTGASIP